MADESPNISFMLGEISGQIRTLNEHVAACSRNIDNLGIRVTALERERDQREGAHGVFAAIARSPVIGWLAAAASVLWVYITGRVQ